jgi:hypothetical protein
LPARLQLFLEQHVKNPLKKYFKGATVKLPFLDMQFGPEAPAQSRVPENEPPAPPLPPKAKGKTANDPFDPEMQDEPDSDQNEIDRPFSLQGSAFERAFLADPEVVTRLNTPRDTHVAQRAIDFFINGVPPDDEDDKDSRTWKQIRAVCLRLIVETLDRYHQRVTYAAVGGIVGLLARSVMYKKPKNHQNSWVVAKATHQPTGYAETEKHLKLEERTLVLVTPNHLREWLRNPI